MKERPILFSGPMVRAILEGKKTQTRRVMKPQPPHHTWTRRPVYTNGMIQTDGGQWIKSPYGVDRLWVREKHSLWKASGVVATNDDAAYCCFPEGSQKFRSGEYYDFDAKKPAWPSHTKWRPSIHMPRWASRLALEATGVRVERLQDITEDDIIAEGISLINGKGWHNPVDGRCYPRAEWAFKYLWDPINAKRGFGWEVNPWVWVISFPRTDSGKEISP